MKVWPKLIVPGVAYALVLIGCQDIEQSTASSSPTSSGPVARADGPDRQTFRNTGSWGYHSGCDRVGPPYQVGSTATCTYLSVGQEGAPPDGKTFLYYGVWIATCTNYCWSSVQRSESGWG